MISGLLVILIVSMGIPYAWLLVWLTDHSKLAFYARLSALPTIFFAILQLKLTSSALNTDDNDHIVEKLLGFVLIDFILEVIFRVRSRRLKIASQ